MLLAVDVGNTRIKAAVFEQHTLLEVCAFEKPALENSLISILNQYPDCTDLIVASVGGIEKEIFLSFGQHLSVHFITHNEHFPFDNRYATPLTLGIDRLVLASGAVLQLSKPKQARDRCRNLRYL